MLKEIQNEKIQKNNLNLSDEGCATDACKAECEGEKTPAEIKSDEKQNEIDKRECALWLNLSAARLNQDKRSEAAQAAQYAIDVDSTNPKGF